MDLQQRMTILMPSRRQMNWKLRSRGGEGKPRIFWEERVLELRVQKWM